jgi:anaerobic glycerol-3-phosphate dehydrogenase
MARAADLLVLGGGVAGVAAALAARAAGARVTLVRAGPGATALSGGGWRGPLAEALARALAQQGHPLEPVAAALPGVAGWREPADFAPPWHAAALPCDDTLVCGVAGLPAFNAAFLARAWAPAVEPGGAAAPALRAATLELPDIPAGGWSPVALAAAVARAPERLGQALGRLARERSAAHVILPAILGLDDPLSTWGAVAAAAGVVVGEAVGGLPSLPGWRLDRALLRALGAAGVELLQDRALGANLAADRPLAVRLAGGAELHPGALVLATGKFLGGGIEAAPALREPALGLPVALERLGERFHEASPLLTTELARAGDQPLLRAGVRVDAQHRPLAPGTGEGGAAAPAGVRVAGSVREGWDAALGGLGAAAADGWAAALAALEGA